MVGIMFVETNTCWLCIYLLAYFARRQRLSFELGLSFEDRVIICSSVGVTILTNNSHESRKTAAVSQGNFIGLSLSLAFTLTSLNCSYYSSAICARFIPDPSWMELREYQRLRNAMTTLFRVRSSRDNTSKMKFKLVVRRPPRAILDAIILRLNGKKTQGVRRARTNHFLYTQNCKYCVGKVNITIVTFYPESNSGISSLCQPEDPGRGPGSSDGATALIISGIKPFISAPEPDVRSLPPPPQGTLKVPPPSPAFTQAHKIRVNMHWGFLRSRNPHPAFV